MSVEVVLPLRTTNPNNGSHGHWAVQAKKRARERMGAAMVLRTIHAPPMPCVVELARISPRRLDSDGLRAALKSVRDEVAIWIGLPVNVRGHAEDSDPRVFWKYTQGKGNHAVVIRARSTSQGEVDALRAAEEYRP
jgi:hypothetical protein